MEEKKVYKGDKAVVGFMPSQLRVTRKETKPKKKPMTKQSFSQSDGGAQGKSVADDYDAFMDEISALK